MIAEGKKIDSRFMSVNGSKIHYRDTGTGNPIIFLHGIPTSGFLWRHIIADLSSCARCVAPDLIGMGKSDKPDIDYRVFDHINYISAFIDSLKLKNITLVMHEWGSVIGLDYARRHEKNIKALALYEAHLQPVKQWNQLSLPVQQLATLLNRQGASYRAVIKQNYFIEKLLPRSAICTLTEADMEQYRAPFLTPESRKPLWQYLNDLPLGRGPDDVVSLIESNSQWLQSTPIPKLLLYAMPGFMTTMADVQWARTNVPALQLATLDDALHLAQESTPHAFSDALMGWYKGL